MAVRKLDGRKGSLIAGALVDWDSNISDYPKMYQRRLGFTSFPVSVEEDSITPATKNTAGSQAEPIITRYTPNGPLEVEVLADDLDFWLFVLMRSGVITSANQATLALPSATLSTLTGTLGTVTAASGAFPAYTFGGGKASLGTYPAQMRVTFSPTAHSFPITAVVTGTQRSGLAATDLKPFSKAYVIPANATTFDFPDYIQEVSAVSYSGGTMTGTAALSTVAASAAKTRTHLMNNDSQQQPMDMQLIIDKLPIVARSMLITQGTYTLGDLMTATYNLIGKSLDLYQMIDSTAEKLTYDKNVTGAALSNFPEPNRGNIFRGGLARLEIGDELDHDDTFTATDYTISGTEGTVDINYNLEVGSPNLYAGKEASAEPSPSETGRVVTMTNTVDARSGDASGDLFPRWNAWAKSGINKSIRLSQLGLAKDGKYYEIQFLCRKAKLTEIPSWDLSAAGDIPITLNWQAGNPAGTDDPRELDVTTIT